MENPCCEIKLPIKIIVTKRKSRYHIWLGRIYEKNRHEERGTLKEVEEVITSFLKEDKERSLRDDS